MRAPRPAKVALLLVGFGSTFLFLSRPTLGHGGTYRGPGDILPPVPASPPGLTVPAGPSGRSGGGLGRPSFPSPGAGSGGIRGGGGDGSFGPGPLRGSAIDFGPDLTGWETWWEVNQDRFLDLRNRRRSTPLVVTGSDQFLLREGSSAHPPGMPSRERLRAEVVPALVGAAADPETAEACLIALAEIGGEPWLADRIRGLLSDRVLAVRETAAIALGILGSEEGLAPLRELLGKGAEGRALAGDREVSARIQSFAAVALALLGRSCESTRVEVHAALRGAVESSPPLRADVRAAAVLALGIVPPPDEAARLAALDLLGRRWARPREDLLVRAQIPLAVGRLAAKGDPRAGKLARTLGDAVAAKGTEREVRQSCVLALGLLVTPDSEAYARSVDLLGETLRSGEFSSRGFAAIALGEIGGERAQLLLERALHTGRPLVRPWVALGLGVLAHGARRPGVPAAVTPPVRALRDLLRRSRAPSTVAAASIALGLAGDAGASAPILDALRRLDEERSLGLVCLGMGLAGDGAGKSEMISLVRESTRRPELLRSAAVASLLLGDAGVVPELLRLFEGSPAAEVAILDALGQVGDGEAIAPLVSRLRDRSRPGIGRRAAAVALGRIGDRRTLPWRAEVAADQNYLAFPAVLFDPAGGTGLLDRR